MTFDTITGHDRQKTILLRAIERRRIAHAYLFSGPDGVGKKLMAVAFARALLCQTGEGCGHCAACRKVDHDNHPDIHSLNSHGAAIKIEQIRDLQKKLSLRPLEGERKICLIDGAEQFTTGAANALLKTLEEPQSGTLIILLTSQPEKLLSTIRSRCQNLPFLRLPKQLLATILAQQLELNETEATVLAALSEGSFKKALGPNRELYLEKRRKLIQSLSALSSGSIIPTFTFADELETEKELLYDILDIFQAFYRDLLLLKHNSPVDELVNIDLLDILNPQVESTTITGLLDKLKALETARYHLQRNVNRRLALEVMLMRVTAA
jgi:DNA polymerase-3 subunit delta'